MQFRQLFCAVLTLIAIAVFAFSETFFSANDEFSNYDLVAIAGVAGLVLGVQIALFAVVARTMRTPTLANALLSAFAIFNFYCLYGSLNVAFEALPLAYQGACFAIGFFIVFTLLRAAAENPRLGIWLPCVALIPILVNLLGLWAVSVSANLPSSTETASTLSTSSENLTKVQFSRTPNVYIVVFDALAPKSLVKKYLGLEPTELHAVLDEQFTGFRNVFAPQVPTKWSLNATLALDEDYFLSDRLTGKRLKIFQGIAPSPLFEIFKFNGYTTNTVYQTSYFGLTKGPYVDGYHINLKFTVCEFIDESTSPLVFFGFCRGQETNAWKQLSRRFHFENVQRSKIDFLIGRYAAGLETGKPQIFVSYIYRPGHSPRNYRHDNERMRADYVVDYARGSRETAAMLRKLLTFIDQNDKDAILFVSGDHGPWMSRNTAFDEDPQFYVTDRHGVYGGVHPASICKEAFSPIRDAAYTTTLQILRRIIVCLADGRDPFLNEPKPVLHVDKVGRRPYAEFLYE